MVRYIVLVVAAALSACSYPVAPSVTPAVNVYSSYDDKVPGKFLVTVDADPAVLSRTVKPTTHFCAAHTFPVDATTTVQQSAIKTIQNVVQEAEMVTAMPSMDQMRASGIAGHIMIKADDFRPKLTCAPGFMQGTCTSTVDLSLGVTVTGATGKLLGTSVGASRSADQGSGMACDGGAQVIGTATEMVVKDAMERLAERLTNAPKLREAAGSGSIIPATAPGKLGVACRVNSVIAAVASAKECFKAGGKVLE